MEPNPRDLVLETAALARIDISSEDVEALGTEFARILDQFRELTEIDVEGVEPMTGATLLRDVTRSDEPRPGIERDAILAPAPDARDGFYAVPKAIGGSE